MKLEKVLGLGSLIRHDLTLGQKRPTPRTPTYVVRALALESLVDEPGRLIPPDSRTYSYTVGGSAALDWEVPVGTSVVMLSVNGERSWQRPVGRVAVFDTELFEGDRFDFTAFDAPGISLAQVRLVARTD